MGYVDRYAGWELIDSHCQPERRRMKDGYVDG